MDTLTAMESLVHPTELSAWGRFLQARSLHRETNRSKNPDWYRPALALNCQLHLFAEGEGIATARLASRSGGLVTWTEVEPPELDADLETLRGYLANLRSEHLSGKARSLGVVLHLADEFAISEIAPLHEVPDDLVELKFLLEEAPQEVIEGQTHAADQVSFRFFPYPGTENMQQPGAAIQISRKHQEFLRLFRDLAEETKFPVRTMGLSAPLVTLAGLPRIIPTLPGQPFCVVLSYSTFSVLAFFSAEGELLMLRSIRNHSSGVAPNVGAVVHTMSAALELDDPVSLVLPLSQKDGRDKVPQLQNASLLDWNEIEAVVDGVPFEFQVATGEKLAPEQRQGLAGTRTFDEIDTNEWATQDFLAPSQEESEMLPGTVEMKVLRFGGIGLKVAAVLLLLAGGWTGLRAFQILRDPAWHAKREDVNATANQLLLQRIENFKKWDSFLADRSKAWVSMELLNRLFPNPGAVVVTELNHTVRPETMRDQKNASLVKEWRLNGYANEDALKHLTTINTREGINEVFKGVHEVTGDASLDPTHDTRNLVVDLKASENKRYKPDAPESLDSQFPFQFNLTISQRFTADDELAIPTSAAR